MPEYPSNAVAIENLQRYLRRLSFGEPSIPDPPVDGIFDTRTEDALREFQRLRGLPITGRADAETWERLYDDYRAALALGTLPRRVSLFPSNPNGYRFTSGDQGFAVTALQYMLRELQADHREFADLPLSGVYDADTAEAIRVFQRKNGFPIDGEVGLLTWNALTDQYNVLFFRAEQDPN
jgi:peptidoglycan hydrolase-like protein with peptidoglycan-binding domain